ncbi:MAG: AbrB/MazE/SpoVT family DNA-binding domain-containing protein [Chloroflexota bacterium]
MWPVVQARITSKGQITIPKPVRDRLGVQQGDALEFRFEGDRLLVEPIPHRSLLEFRGRFAVPAALNHEDERAMARSQRVQRLTGSHRQGES